MAEDIRQVLLAEIINQPGITAHEIAARHPDFTYKRIGMNLRRLCENWKEAYRVELSGLGGGWRRYQYYPARGIK